ncbi:MAG: methionyl-tRNA synthetase [Solirubrobacteraceae bacterium]|jgi:methionyl-tRNA synthetase|nr:methionyl-tRNA synthetase [Solirubrobacteraceae bacterium]
MSFYVTTPIYYVNAAPHLGHAYSTIAADVLARHMRQRGEDVFFLTGTDEHGEPVALAAEREGVTPQQLVDRNAPRFKDLMPRLNVSNDFFIRTTDAEHMAAATKILSRIRDNGHVYEGVYEGWYCPRCADFKSDAEAGPDDLCPIHRTALIREKEDNYFFRLSAFQDDLLTLLDEQPDFVMPKHRYNEARSFIESGLQDVSLSRSTFTWGVPVPWNPDHVFYVWFEALLNYYTALCYARPGEDLTDRFWPAQFHVIGKDILKFHTVFWPAMLMAAGLPLPKHVFVHGFLLVGKDKMGKSAGNAIDPFATMDEYGTDALRYYLMREVTFGQDGAVSLESFRACYESELANGLGNLASRTIAMIHRYRDGVVPTAALDPALTADIDGAAEEVAVLLDRADLSAAADAIWLRVRRLNRYVEERAPWTLARESGHAGELDVVLASLADALRVLAVLLHPWMPQSMSCLLDALGAPELAIEGARMCAGRLGAVGMLPPLFPKPDSRSPSRRL